jgi:ferrochelatase
MGVEPVNTEAFDHEQAGKIGVLVTNLGTPTAPTARALRPYLRQFLSDRRVVDLPRILWWPLLNGVILNVRPRRSAEAYAKIWTDEGSPLFVHTRDQARELGRVLESSLGDRVLVDFGFRYGEPSIPSAIDALVERGARQLLVLPLYPQYSGPTVGSTLDAVAAHLTQQRWVPDIRFVTHYHDHPGYIAALAESIQAHWEQHGRADKLLFSYHGIPERYRDSGDPYYCECLKTTRLVAENLGLEEGSYELAFQSRFGPGEWVKPYTDKVLAEWAEGGVGSVQVICPAFSADCLETLEEIDIQYRVLFLNHGGQRFEYIPALNTAPAHIALMAELVERNLQGWLDQR